VKGVAEPSLVLSTPKQPSDLDDGLRTSSEVAQPNLTDRTRRGEGAGRQVGKLCVAQEYADDSDGRGGSSRDGDANNRKNTRPITPALQQAIESH
jgi:hypothetical protein